ncbi:MAG TPA: non-heme iron oxygenase ferredoxin subunit [Chloroflexia bacterium]|nr:non-heme iron oxygenase ferredoxin subunit [Chloroflexia bacterium]
MDRQKAGAGLKATDIPPGSCGLGRAGNEEVAVFNVEGQFYATQNRCTHAGGPLCEGGLWGDVVQCPWHGSEFNVRTGEVVSGPARVPVKTYSVTVQDGVISIGEE